MQENKKIPKGILKNYEFNLIKIAIAKKINNTPTTNKAIFNILVIVDFDETDEILLTAVVSWLSVVTEVVSKVELANALSDVVLWTEFSIFDELPVVDVFSSVFIDIVLSIDEVNWFSSIA